MEIHMQDVALQRVMLDVLNQREGLAAAGDLEIYEDVLAGGLAECERERAFVELETLRFVEVTTVDDCGDEARSAGFF